MSEKLHRILFVDDETNILSSIRRQLRGRYELLLAESGDEGIEIIKKEKNVELAVSDFKMPKMNGVEFLAKVREISPETVRMMLTGQADMEAVINVINHGNIFRFLTKPCPPDLLVLNIEDGLEQHRLVKAEKELIAKTLSGAIQVLTDILVLAKPEVFNRAVRIRDVVRRMMKYITMKNAWQVEIAAMLSQIGCVTVPDSIIDKVYRNLPLPPEDRVLYQLHVNTSSELIVKIPRLEGVADIIRYQGKYFNGEGIPRDDIKGEDIPMGARILSVAIDYDREMQFDATSVDALETIKKKKGFYDESVVMVLDQVVNEKPERRKFTVKHVTVRDLNESMYLSKEIVSGSGVIIGGKNQRITMSLIVTLENYLQNKEILEPISVLTYVE